jgi:hypothetical protein
VTNENVAEWPSHHHNSKPLPFPSDAIPEVTSDGNESLGVMVRRPF